ncbi:MAG: hypothetical protein KUG56_08980 [Kordiimonadaceae bacterium]|nr:hypothetical protein [Kordiimonadaceae bacterium]
MKKFTTATLVAGLMVGSAALVGAAFTGVALADGHSHAQHFDGAALDAVLALQSDEMKARYKYRHPKETLAFFGITPGMTVGDLLPGRPGYYSRILSSYLGEEGKVVGIDYSMDMWNVWQDGKDEFLEKRANWAGRWTENAQKELAGNGAALAATALGAAPAEIAGKLDAIVAFRAMHHLNRFEHKGGHFTKGLAAMFAALKPGGIVGIVQHRAPEGNSDAWAVGDNGYIKQAALVKSMEVAGFVFDGASEINANPKDMPTEEDKVWRLPPALGTSRENAELRATMEAIGESDRMTLKFHKPE